MISSSSFLEQAIGWSLGLLDQQALGWFLGLADYSFKLLQFLPTFPKFFSKGWGNTQAVLHKHDMLLQQVQQNGAAFLSSKIELEWDKDTVEKVAKGVTMQKASFESPCADLLPVETKRCQFDIVRPSHNNNNNNNNNTKHPPVYVFMLPATGEEGKRTRLQLAKYLAQQFGWSSVILTAPYYAARKPATQRLYFLNTVADFKLQTFAIAWEAAALATYFVKQQNALVCISGFSWGGAAAAAASAIALHAGIGHSMACVPYVGCSSLAVLVDGIFKDSVDYAAFSNTSSIRRELWRFLYTTQLTTFSERLPLTTPKAAVCVAITATHDKFIQQHYSHEMVKQLPTFVKKLTVRALAGGHMMAMFLRPWIHRDAILEAVKELIELNSK